MKIKTFSKQLVSILVVSLLLATGITSSFAQTKSSSSVKNTTSVAQHHQTFTTNIKTVLAGLVKNKTITQAQSAAVLKTFQAQKSAYSAANKAKTPKTTKAAKANKSNIFSSLVKKGTITQAQANAIQSALATANKSVHKTKTSKTTKTKAQ